MQDNEYIDLKKNGKIFPTWIVKNFKKYKLPNVIIQEGEDPCNIQIKQELNKYQTFISKYMSPESSINEILIYHNLGSGKTATIINLMNVFFNYDPSINIVLLIKASLHDDPWLEEMKKWLARDGNLNNVPLYKNIRWVHFNSPIADKKFFDEIKGLDLSKKTMYVIDEVHGFISNVYSNINSKNRRRAQSIYDFIYKEKQENKNTKIVLASATPAINIPFELSLLFNLLRPGCLPLSEAEFNRLFITENTIYPILNPLHRNLFVRRILGLVSYYIGSTPDKFAKQEHETINLEMSQYQYDIYREFEQKEISIEKSSKQHSKGKSTPKLYKTYTRQASNFVFPDVSSVVNGLSRPRPNKFKLTEKLGVSLEKGKIKETNASIDAEAIKQYMNALNHFLTETEKYFHDIHKIDVKNGRTVIDDVNEFRGGFNDKYEKSFKKFYEDTKIKSDLLMKMYECSPKMSAIAFMTYISNGKVMIYSNYVLMEGLDMMRVYLKLLGFNDYKTSAENMGYCEYHGRFTQEERKEVKKMYNSSNNIRGNKCKVIMLSPSGTEGIQLYNMKQEHIMEPYWTEVRIQQVIGRGIRQCSHKELPIEERVINVYRYKTVKPEKLDESDTKHESTDEHIESWAKSKDNLMQTFLSALKEAAVDCELFKSHNMMSQLYSCFNFSQTDIMTKNIGPAYLEDIKQDMLNDSGLHAANTKVVRIKVIKVKAVKRIDVDKFSNPDIYWFDNKSNIFYDYETYYPIGRAEILNNIPLKTDKDTFVINDLVMIPSYNSN